MRPARRRLCRICLVWLWPLATVLGDAVEVPVYGVLNASDFDPAAATYFLAQEPQCFRTLWVGTASVSVASGTFASESQAFASGVIYHAWLVPRCHALAGGYVLDAPAVGRIERIADSSGSLATTVLADPGLAAALPFTASSQQLLVYALLDPSVPTIALGNGVLLPSASDAQQFRWLSALSRMRGTSDGVQLLAGGAAVAPLGSCLSHPLASYHGAYVQLRDAVSGSYRYLTQDAITLDDPTQYDPVAADGQLLLGGSCQLLPPSSRLRVAYPLLGATLTGSCALRDCMPATALPPALALSASHSELAPASAAGPTQVVTTQHRGPVPLLDSSGQPTGQQVTFYGGAPANQQSTVQVLSDIDRQRANAISPQPTDTMTANGRPDRITTPVAGGSGLSQLQAQVQAATWHYDPTPTASDVTTTLSASGAASPTAAGAGQSLSASALLALSDASLDDQLTTTYAATGAAQPAQRTPLVVDARGTIAAAGRDGRSQEIYGAVDIVNQVMAPHLEDTQWPGGLHPHHHQALIHAIDYLDRELCATYSAATGVTIPDQEGDSVPGDGENPYQPLPQGCQAGHPFYDLDGDGSLDRFGSDDPFQGGYRKLKLLWNQQPGGSYQLGDFQVTPSYNLCVVGIMAPRRMDDGSLQAHEDLLLTIGHSFRPFSHESLHRLSYQTFYGAGLISPLDPLGDPGCYQFALSNVATMHSSTPPTADGVDPALLVPSVVSGVQDVTRDLTHSGVPQHYTLAFTIDFYDGLASAMQTPPWVWQWSQASYQLPAGVVDHPATPAVVHETLTDAAGVVASRLQVSRPLAVDPLGVESGPFDPSLLSASTAPSPQVAVSDTYQWAYPQGRSSAEGGTLPADPLHWHFPWNLAWTDDVHSRNQSSQGFTLDSANMAWFPDYQSQTPLISHQSLSAASDGLSPPALQWRLRENPAPAPSGDPAAWADGEVLYTQPGWLPGQPWLTPGRGCIHLPWDARSDLWGADRSLIGNVLRPSGMRVFDVVAGYATYTFRGAQHTCTTLAQQLALLQRMWNYDLTGYEQPPAHTTTLPSLCIPQHLDNHDPASPLLASCRLPSALGSEVSAQRDAPGQDGGLSGQLVSDLGSATGVRAQVQRRLRLMNSQIFLFSAARGREWELQMARRMPSSTRLICVEYDDRQAVKAVLGVHGGNVVFPTITTTTITDRLGGVHSVETSNEITLLKEVAQQWFDSQAPVVCSHQGALAIGADTSLHTTTVGSGLDATSGSGTTIDTAAVDAYAGFAAMLPEGIPAGLACYAYPLRCLPAAPRQWAPDPGQALLADYQIEFRHPMLILYHDQASSIYVHYGRNADPDQVFGQWDRCAPPPADMPVTSGELQRRLRFDAYANAQTLSHCYDCLHPADAQLGGLLLVSMPPAPPDPGAPPTPPVSVAYPGLEPQPPQLQLRNWDLPGAAASYQTILAPPCPAALDGYDAQQAWAPWNGDPSYAATPPAAQWTRFLGSTPEFDLASRGWLRIPYSQSDGQGVPLEDPQDWQPGAGEDYYPIGGANSGCSSLLYGDVIASLSIHASHSDNSLSFYQLHSDCTPGGLSALLAWTGTGVATIPAGPCLLVASNDSVGSGEMWYTDHLGSQSYAAISHPMTLRYYQAYAVLPTVDAYQAIYHERQDAISAFTAQWQTYQDQDAQWRAQSAGYAQWLAAQDAYPPLQRRYQQALAAWNQWQADAAALAASQAAAEAYQQQRQQWVEAVLAQIQAQAVSWEGDPLLLQTTLAQITALAPSAPIWQAYAYAIDPAHGLSPAQGSPP